MTPASRLAAAGIAVGLFGIGCDRRPERVIFGVGMTADTHMAVKLAAEEINAAGGIRGARLELTGLDWGGQQDTFDPDPVLKLAQRFVNTDDLIAVIGHSDSASTLSAAALYNKYRVPQIVTIATNPAITNIGTWTYRLCLSDAAQGPALAEYAINDWKKRRIAIFYVNDDYGRGLAQLFEQRARALGAEIVATVMHRNVLTDDDKQVIRSTLARLKGERAPDVFALFQRLGAAEWTATTLRDAGFDADILGGDNLAQGAFARMDRAVTSRARVSQFLWLDAKTPRAAAFAERFRRRAGTDPNYGQAFGYDAVYLLRDAVLHGGFTRDGVKAYLDRLIADSTPIHGVAGTFIFGPDHDARRALYIADIRNQTFHVIKSIEPKPSWP